jgi:hypothetical protein
MIRFLIKVPTQYTDDKRLVWDYSLMVLNEFKQIIRHNINYVKIKIRYDYLIDNEILQFEGRSLGYKQIIELLLSKFVVSYISTNSNNYQTCIGLNESFIIPNSNMSFANFLKFIQYGNFDIQPYPFVNSAWTELNDTLEKGNDNV